MNHLAGVVAIVALFVGVLVATTEAAAAADPPPSYVWAKVLEADNHSFAHDIAVDAGGNSYVTGEFVGTLDLNPGVGTFNVTSNGQTDVFVAKYNVNGAFVWGGSIGGPTQDSSGAIAIDGGDVYLGGTFDGTVDFDLGVGVNNLTSTGDDGFVLQVDTGGNFQWAVAQGDSVGDIDARSGRVNATGGLTSTFDFDPGPGMTELMMGDGEVWVSELTVAGGLAWAVNYEGQRVSAIAVDPSGNVYTAGTHQDGADMDPGLSTFVLPATDFADLYISKLDTHGSFIWAKGFGTTAVIESINDLAVTTAAVFATGSFENTVDFDPGAGMTTLTAVDREDAYVLKLNSVGDFAWVAGLHAIGPNDLGTGVAVDDDGNVIATGYFSETVDFDPGPGTFELVNSIGLDVYAWKLSSSGAFIWAGTIGGEANSNETARAGELALDASGNPLIVGRVSAAIDFDFDPQSGTVFIPASNDAFILKLDGAARCNDLAVTIDMNTNGGIGAGTAGNDVILGTPGNDSIGAGAGDDTVCAGDGADTIIGGPGADTLFGDGGADTIRGSGGPDLIDGGAGGDTILGQGGADTIDGGSGSDTIDGQGAADTIDGGPGNDTINGQNGGDELTGGVGDDLLRGQVGPDTFMGEAGDDDMFGGEGADTFFGGAGFDKCAGNTGPDQAEAASCEQTPGVESFF